MKLLAVILLLLVSMFPQVSYADNYDSARKIMQADKEVRDYQSAKAGGYGFIYDDTKTGEAVIGFIIIGVGLLIGVAWLKDVSRHWDKNKRMRQASDYLDALSKPNAVYEYPDKETFASLGIGDSFYVDLIVEKYPAVKIYKDACVLTDTLQPGSRELREIKASKMVTRIILSSMRNDPAGKQESATK